MLRIYFKVWGQGLAITEELQPKTNDMTTGLERPQGLSCGLKKISEL